MTTSIYNTSSLKDVVPDSSSLLKDEASQQPTKKRTKSLNHDGWNLWNQHPDWELDVHSSSPLDFNPLRLSISGSETMYDWCNTSCPHTVTYKNSYGEQVTKGSPYNYHRLLGSVCPHFFGIYQDNMQVIQIQLDKLKNNNILSLRTLSISQLNSFLYQQMNEMNKRIRGCEEEDKLRQVFNNEMWQADRHHRHFLHISEYDIERFLPTLTKFDDEIVLWHLQPSKYEHDPRKRWASVIYKVEEYHGPDLINFELKDAMYNIMGRETPADDFKLLLGEHDLSTDIRPLNKILSEAGMKVIKTRRKIKGKVTTFYTVIGLVVTEVASQPYFYPKERTPLV